MISLQVGPRSDATEQFGRVPPRSLFDLERDAEVQEIQRCLARLHADTDAYLDVQRMRTTRFMQFIRLFAGLIVLALGAVAGSVWEMRAAQAPTPEMFAAATPNSMPIPKTKAVIELPVVGLPDATVTAAAAQPAPDVQAPVKSAEPVVVAAATPAAEQPPVPPKLTTVAVVAAVAKPITPAVASVKPVTVRAPVGAAKPANTPLPKDEPVPAVAAVKTAQDKDKPTTSTAQKQVPEEVLFALEGSQPVSAPPAAAQRPVREPVKEPTPEPAKEAVRTHAATPKATASAKTQVTTAERPVASSNAAGTGTPARRDRYSARGVITMTDSGVVIFDQERRSQRLIPVGAHLPDGSVLKGVDVKASRISTDAGDVIFD